MMEKVDQWNFPLTEPPTTTILMPTYNEAPWIKATLESLEKQNVRVAYPERFELIVVDSASSDGTREIAANYADKVIITPRGKLTSITVGIREAKGDVIVAVDGDCRYYVNFLNLLLRHFEDSSVVAVSGSELITHPWNYTLYSVILEWILMSVNPRMMGRGSAYSKEGFYQVGGFNLSIDQFNLWKMVEEEEFHFQRKLRTVGRYVHDLQATVFTTPRRMVCVLGGKYKQFCDSKECEAIRKYCEEVKSGTRFR